MAKIWIWGQPATGDLKRPFKVGGGLFGSMDSGPQTDKVRAPFFFFLTQASVKEAEKVSSAITAKAE